MTISRMPVRYQQSSSTASGGELEIYHGEPECYSAFISPEASIGIGQVSRILGENIGEEITESWPLF